MGLLRAGAFDEGDGFLVVITGDHTEKYSKETISFIKIPGAEQSHMTYNSMPYPVKALAATVLAEKGLRDPSRSMFFKKMITDGSSIRNTNSTEIYSFSGFHPVKCLEPIGVVFHNNTFELDQKMLKISRTNNPGSQNEILLRIRSLDGKTAYESPKADIDGGNFDQFQCPITAIAPGRYIVEIIEKRNALENTEEDKTLLSFSSVLPLFLIVDGENDRFVKDYPDIQMRPLTVGEEITFAPMKPYYSISFSDDCQVDIERLEISEKSTISVMVPAEKNTLSLQLEIRTFSSGPLALEVLNDQMPILKTQYTKDNNFLIEIPLKKIQANTLNLSFKLMPKYKNITVVNRNMQLVNVKLIGK